MKGYCLKCRANREISTPTKIVMKNGKNAVKGTCPTCGKVIFTIVKKS